MRKSDISICAEKIKDAQSQVFQALKDFRLHLDFQGFDESNLPKLCVVASGEVALRWKSDCNKTYELSLSQVVEIMEIQDCIKPSNFT